MLQCYICIVVANVRLYAANVVWVSVTNEDLMDMKNIVRMCLEGCKMFGMSFTAMIEMLCLDFTLQSWKPTANLSNSNPLTLSLISSVLQKLGA
jgi:hypothetical protein